MVIAIIDGMRTFGVLVGGWLVGGALIVLLGVERSSARPADIHGERASRPPAADVSSGSIQTPGEIVAVGGWDASSPRGSIQMPVVGVGASELTDTFLQARGGGRTHRALDILAPRGTPVVAAVDGTIRKIFNSKAGGLTIYQFDRAEERVYYYAHLDRYANGLQEGWFVQQGTVIGYVGTTGNAAGTPHLHFAVEVLPPTKEWWKGEPINPYPLLTEAR
ncbi:MAG TPA: M23 family metallopeptidase [Rhodothermia bacterium]|nr:M23 family metallopeptidase [Rhodothermia bacterium]